MRERVNEPVRRRWGQVEKKRDARGETCGPRAHVGPPRSFFYTRRAAPATAARPRWLLLLCSSFLQHARNSSLDSHRPVDVASFSLSLPLSPSTFSSFSALPLLGITARSRANTALAGKLKSEHSGGSRDFVPPRKYNNNAHVNVSCNYVRARER